MKKLLVITGAGASLDFGMPSVKDIDELFEKWAFEILPLKDSSSESLYSWVKKKLTDSYLNLKNPNNRLEYLLNFENLLFTIQNIYSISKDKQYSHFNRLNPFIQIDEFPEIVKFKREKKADSFDFHFLHSYLVDKLLEFFREKCKSLTKTKAVELSLLKSFFDTLKTKFELGVINLNYDNVILSALPNLRTGFDENTGKFKRALIHKSTWDFCYHLHGSVHFDMKGGEDNTEMHKICWNHDLSSMFSQNSSGRSGNYTSEGVDHLSSNIITGLDKSNQLLREPFCSYFMQLDRLVYEADAILFLGYGFNDLHLNNTFPFIRYDKDKIRKVVIVDWASDSEDGLTFRYDGWSHGVFATLPSNSFEMGTDKSSLPQPTIYFKNSKTLEKSKNPNLPLAIWYNGLLEGCKNSQKILNELI